MDRNVVSIDDVAPVARACRRLLTKRVHFVDDFLLIPNVERIDGEFLEKADRYSVQLLPRRIRDFHIYTSLYEPQLAAEDLGDDIETRREQLGIEVEKMRTRMQEMADRLKQLAP